MPAPASPRLKPGRVYRTRDLSRWGTNPARLARRLEIEGRLKRLGQGLFLYPRRTRFGELPPDDRELMRAFLKGSPFIFSGPELWNALGLGATAVFPARLVYNTKRSGEFILGKRRFILRRVQFPRQPTPEWSVIDLAENHAMAGLAWEALDRSLAAAVREGRFDIDALRNAARRFGTQRTQALVERAVRAGKEKGA